MKKSFLMLSMFLGLMSAIAFCDSSVLAFDSTLSTKCTMYEGDSTFVDIKKGSNGKCEFKSSDTDVLTVSANGKIKAVSEGDATVLVIYNDGKDYTKARIDVSVLSSNFRSHKSHGSGISAASKYEGIILNHTFYKGSKTRIKINAPAGAVIRYESDDEDIVTVSDEGLVKAKTPGKATVWTYIKYEGEQIKYPVRYFVEKKQSMPNSLKDSFYENSIFIGNSVGLGLRYYQDKQPADFLGNMLNCSVESYSIFNDRQPISAKSLHPTVNGVKMRAKDAVKASGAKKVLVNMGLNDMYVFGKLSAVDNYKLFIEEIQKENKKIPVYIVSMTPVYKEKGALTNANINTLNAEMKAYAKSRKNVYFINIHDAMVDENGALRKDYCSDKFCHLTNAAYAAWTESMRKFAEKQLS
ncbi:MAG: Ig-like domain-containing protein [Lachnospiraceae bacterium]|nr:Ig-like domain-containing protein [Lachnospiraceae bacterium]